MEAFFLTKNFYFQSNFYVLYEHAAGYALFQVKEFEEIAMLLPEVEEAVLNVTKFKSLVSLTGFLPFKTAIAALENVNAVSEGIVTEELALFLDGALPSKKKKLTLGIAGRKNLI